MAFIEKKDSAFQDNLSCGIFFCLLTYCPSLFEKICDIGNRLFPISYALTEEHGYEVIRKSYWGYCSMGSHPFGRVWVFSM